MTGKARTTSAVPAATAVASPMTSALRSRPGSTRWRTSAKRANHYITPISHARSGTGLNEAPIADESERVMSEVVADPSILRSVSDREPLQPDSQ